MALEQQQQQEFTSTFFVWNHFVFIYHNHFGLMLWTIVLASAIASFWFVFVIPTTRAWVWYPKTEWKDLQHPTSQLDGPSRHQLDQFNARGDFDVTHFCFLIHGHRGLSQDLSYLQAIMRVWTDQEKLKLANAPPSENRLRQDLIIYSPTSNEHKTKDGVVQGGTRLANEIMDIIRKHMEQNGNQQQKQKQKQVTISIVGNSLGGIYGRYAIALLPEVLDDKYQLSFNIFCTTATPHLGVSKHTWVPLPRAAEIGIAQTMGDTGKDLFRLNDVMKTMVTPKFLEPLRRFRKRIAYANAYGTDFPVPTQTAAFLSEESAYPHHFVESTNSPNASSSSDGTGVCSSISSDDDETTPTRTTTTAASQNGSNSELVVVDDNGLVIATLHTPPGNASDAKIDQENTDDLVQMSRALDSLGWKKVFVDVRKEIPMSFPVPKELQRRLKQKRDSDGGDSVSSRGSDNANESTTVEGDSFAATTAALPSNKSLASSSSSSTATVSTASANTDCPLESLKQKRVVESKDIAQAISKPPTLDKITVPLGHNMIVAFSRNKVSTLMNKPGRPVVNALAKELVEDIFQWDLIAKQQQQKKEEMPVQKH